MATFIQADWETMQLRHLLDKADIDYANKVDRLTSTYEDEKGNFDLSHTF